jgi:hypothetical protein
MLKRFSPPTRSGQPLIFLHFSQYFKLQPNWLLITFMYYMTTCSGCRKTASPGFFDNKRKKDAAAAAALKETGGRNEFRHPVEIRPFLSLSHARALRRQKSFSLPAKRTRAAYLTFPTS